mmetsp:Transcript_12385/g.27299  ORF Transcript_12385/g.27299 Transcript_12385/m.27299 type:complete len:202 (+) Transcript_12385:1029-1634(+)
MFIKQKVPKHKMAMMEWVRNTMIMKLKAPSKIATMELARSTIHLKQKVKSMMATMEWARNTMNMPSMERKRLSIKRASPPSSMARKVATKEAERKIRQLILCLTMYLSFPMVASQTLPMRKAKIPFPRVLQQMSTMAVLARASHLRLMARKLATTAIARNPASFPLAKVARQKDGQRRTASMWLVPLLLVARAFTFLKRKT